MFFGGITYLSFNNIDLDISFAGMFRRHMLFIRRQSARRCFIFKPLARNNRVKYFFRECDNFFVTPIIHVERLHIMISGGKRVCFR